jgi:3-methyladenine DNA glycosylase AlkC
MIIETMLKIEREKYSRKFLNKHFNKITKKQKEQAIKILVDFQKFKDIEESKLDKIKI